MIIKTRPTFTLVELLVLIALICIVSALLLPALQKTLRSARLLSCANNQKQFSVAFSSYADENNGHVPKPWNRGYPFRLRDSWSPTDPYIAMGLAVFYRDGYLADGNIVLCTDMVVPASTTEYLYPGQVVDSLEIVSQTGRFSSVSRSFDSTYVVNIGANVPDQSTVTGDGHHAWEWPNYVDYYGLLGIASKLSGNLPGGRNYRASNNSLAHIRSPRPYLACGFPNTPWPYKPHGLEGFNTLYADGVIHRILFNPDVYQTLTTVSIPVGFRSLIQSQYPGYRPPQ